MRRRSFVWVFYVDDNMLNRNEAAIDNVIHGNK